MNRNTITVSIRFLSGVLLLVCGLALCQDSWEAQRKAALDRPRKILYNNDGCDAVYFPPDKSATDENFASERLYFIRGTAVDTVIYNVMQGFNKVIYRSKVAEVHFASPPSSKGSPEIHPNARSIMEEMIRRGSDPLKAAVDFCHREKREIFASLRFNDIHDQVHTPEKPFYLMSQLKINHPEYLMGTSQERPPFCIWSAVDYTRHEIRSQMKAIVREICENYDIDGIEYDLMRHIQLFKSVAMGGRASQEELDILTALMVDLREITETAGKKRGRPILVSVRIPDSTGYCRAVGIDLETWLDRRLVDMASGASYFQFNLWGETAKLVQSRGVKFYASLDESRIERPGLECIEGRSIVNRSFMFAREAAAMAEGCDGVYFFNLEYGRLSNIAGVPLEELKFCNKDYYARERGSGSYRSRQFLKGGGDFENMPKIDPGEPLKLNAGEAYSFVITVGDDFTDPEVRNRVSVLRAVLLAETEAVGVDLDVNGNTIKAETAEGGLYFFNLNPEFLKPGRNSFALKADKAMTAKDFCVKVNYRPDAAPELEKYRDAAVKLLARVAVADAKPVVSALIENRYIPELMPVEGKSLHLIHNSGKPGAGGMYFNAVKAVRNPVDVMILEWRARVMASRPGEEVFLVIPGIPNADGKVRQETIGMSRYEVSTKGAGKVLGDFTRLHTFRVALDTASGKYTLWIDGTAALAGQALPTWGSGKDKPSFFFGDCSGRVGGEVELEYFHIAIPE